MPNSQDHSRNLFLEYYEDYIDAKDKKRPLKTWLKAYTVESSFRKLVTPATKHKLAKIYSRHL